MRAQLQSRNVMHVTECSFLCNAMEHDLLENPKNTTKRIFRCERCPLGSPPNSVYMPFSGGVTHRQTSEIYKKQSFEFRTRTSSQWYGDKRKLLIFLRCFNMFLINQAWPRDSTSHYTKFIIGNAPNCSEAHARCTLN